MNSISYEHMQNLSSKYYEIYHRPASILKASRTGKPLRADKTARTDKAFLISRHHGVNVYTLSQSHTHTRTHTHTRARAHTRTHTHTLTDRAFLMTHHQWCVCIYTFCNHTRTHTHTHTHTRARTHTHTHTHTH